MVDSKNTVESSICDLDRLVQLVSQLSNQYRKLISYLPSTCGPELLPEFTALTDCRGGVVRWQIFKISLSDPRCN
jgi:hypothetical protein